MAEGIGQEGYDLSLNTGDVSPLVAAAWRCSPASLQEITQWKGAR